MIIRKLKESDAEEYRKFLFQLDKETDFMLYEVGERKSTILEIEKTIRNINCAGGCILVVVDEVKNEILGYLLLARGILNKIKHSGFIVIGILEVARRKGYGEKLFLNAHDWAKNAGISKLELTVMVNNKIALKLYKKMGYEIEGTKKNSIKFNGKIYDEYFMGKIIK